MPGVFERAGFSQKQRLIIFLTICIPVRLLLAYITKKYNQSNILKFATLLFALLTTIMIVISIISSNYKFVPYILLSDVIIGALKYINNVVLIL